MIPQLRSDSLSGQHKSQPFCFVLHYWIVELEFQIRFVGYQLGPAFRFTIKVSYGAPVIVVYDVVYDVVWVFSTQKTLKKHEQQRQHLAPGALHQHPSPNTQQATSRRRHKEKEKEKVFEAVS